MNFCCSGFTYKINYSCTCCSAYNTIINQYYPFSFDNIFNYIQFYSNRIRPLRLARLNKSSADIPIFYKSNTVWYSGRH